VDVAIVGGGVTGCSCAYLFAKSGLKVALADAGEIGHGSTIASTALVMQEPDVDFADLSARFGPAVSERVWKQSRQATRAFLRTLDSVDADTAFETVPSIYFSRDANRAAELQRELARRHRAGLRGRWLSSAALEAHTGLTGAGAILTTGNSLLDPYRACVALAAAASDIGARLFTRSKVVRIRQAGDRTDGSVRVELERGSIRARRVVIATGYATADFKPLAGRFRMFNTYVVATRPLTPRERRATRLSNVMLWDTERPYHYARWTPDHRLIFGGQDRPQTPGRRRTAALRSTTNALLEELGEFYPTLRGIDADYAWEGLFATTPDGLPYIGAHRRYPNHLFALGYGGNGITFGFLAAQVLTRALHDRSLPDDELFAFNRHHRRDGARASAG
jgi:glycine/D-amino acid oxidase-like deaminating enzyme